MNIYNIYNKDKNTSEQRQPVPVTVFFRKEISETRTFVRHINANKKFSPTLVRLAKAKTKSQKAEILM